MAQNALALAPALPYDLTHRTTTLASKPGATLYYTFVGDSDAEHDHHNRHHYDQLLEQRILVVFLNGLMTDKSSWLPVMAGAIERYRKAGSRCVPMLTYDRYGQGLSGQRDSGNGRGGRENENDAGYTHDLADVVHDLHELVAQVAHEQLGVEEMEGSTKLQVVFVANSIGCAVARFFAQLYPRTVAGMLLLDSIMANSNFDLWPDPDADGFREGDLPKDISIEVLREQRAKFASTFGPSVVNKEKLDRRNLAKLLPYSDRPKLVAPDGGGPWVTVVGHDAQVFANESLKVLGNVSFLKIVTDY